MGAGNTVPHDKRGVRFSKDGRDEGGGVALESYQHTFQQTTTRHSNTPRRAECTVADLVKVEVLYVLLPPRGRRTTTNPTIIATTTTTMTTITIAPLLRSRLLLLQLSLQSH